MQHNLIFFITHCLPVNKLTYLFLQKYLDWNQNYKYTTFITSLLKWIFVTKVLFSINQRLWGKVVDLLESNRPVFIELWKNVLVYILTSCKCYKNWRRANFCAWLRNNNSKLNNIFWSDEAYLHLDGDISRYHCRIWTMQRPKHYLTKSLHPQKIWVWFVFTATFKLQQFFFESTIDSNNYLKMLQEY